LSLCRRVVCFRWHVRGRAEHVKGGEAAPVPSCAKKHQKKGGMTIDAHVASLIAFAAITAGGYLLHRFLDPEGSAHNASKKALYYKWANAPPALPHADGDDAAKPDAKLLEELAALRSLLEKERAEVQRLSKLFGMRDSELADLEETIETLKQVQERAVAEQRSLKDTIAEQHLVIKHSLDDKAH